MSDVSTPPTLTLERVSFVEWGSSGPPPTGKFTGVVTYRRVSNGSRLCEREYWNGSTWGTCRYFNENDRLVGQCLYGTAGYDVTKTRQIGGGVQCHSAKVNPAEHLRVSQLYRGNYQSLYKVCCSFIESHCTGKTGVDLIFYSSNNNNNNNSNDVRSFRSIAEREWGDGTAWGCCRYYDEQGQLVGQVYHGGMSRQKVPIDTNVLDPRVPVPRGSFLTQTSDLAGLQMCRQEYLANRTAMLWERLWQENVVQSKKAFVDLLVNVDKYAIQIAQQAPAGEIPDDVDSECNLQFGVLRNHISRWVTDDTFLAALEKLPEPVAPLPKPQPPQPVRSTTATTAPVAFVRSSFPQRPMIVSKVEASSSSSAPDTQRQVRLEERQVRVEERLARLEARYSSLEDQLRRERDQHNQEMQQLRADMAQLVATQQMQPPQPAPQSPLTKKKGRWLSKSGR